MRPFSGFLPLLCSFFLVNLCSGNAVEKTVVVFKKGETKVTSKGDNNEITEHTPTDFSVPAFVGGVLNETEFLAIICSASLHTALSQSTFNGVALTSYGNYNQWSKAEIFTHDTQKSTTQTVGNEFTAVMKENKIYVLGKCFYKEENQQHTGRFNKGWEPLMFVGTVKAATDSDVNGASITWEAGKPLKNVISDTVSRTQETSFHGGMGNSIVTKSGAIVFPIQINAQPSKTTSSIMYSTDNGSTWKIGAETHDETYEGSVVEWGDGKLLLIASSNGGFRKVFESEDMGRTWEESLVFSRVWGNVDIRKSFGKQGSAIKVPVDSGDVLLFAHPLTAQGGSSADTLQLWLSDGQRIVRIGTISDSEKEDHTGNSILAHVGDHLYITHEINPNRFWGDPGKFKEWVDVIGLTPLQDFFEIAKTTVNKWRELDTSYQNIGINTSSLVGVLGNSKDDKVWADMYNCVNATVKGATIVEGGFRFDGKAESGAQWPVESQGQNQVYMFTKEQFTLTATVIIHTGKDTGEFPLIGASLDSQGSKVLFGLGYTHDNKWYVVSNNNKQKSTTVGIFKRKMEYHVALTFANEKASVYVDGVSITDGEITLSSPDRIHHFYIGGIEESSSEKGTSCTVKHVMLFNQPLLQSDIAQLAQVCKKSKVEEEEETSTELPTLITVDRTSVSTTNLEDVPESGKSVPKSKPKESSVPSLKNVIYEKENGTKMHKFQNELRDGIVKKDTKGNTDAVMSLSSVGCMVFICLFIVLAGF